MKVCAWALLAIPLLRASDDGQLATAIKAQSDFERVELTLRPRIPDAEACMQSQAAALAVSPPEQRSLLLYRKGYCAFAGAAATNDPRRFFAAAADFEKAIGDWPLRRPKNPKHAPPDPLSAALPIFAGIAHLHATTDAAVAEGARKQIAEALESPSCISNLARATFCGELLGAGSEWLGWSALLANHVDEAARRFSKSTESGWSAWAQGRLDFDAARYAPAAEEYGSAITRWKLIWQGEGPTFLQSLGPRPRLAPALADWGGARLLAGDYTGAILTLDASLQADSANARTLYLRARAKELAGKADAALVDYNLASRTAFAAAQDLASGEAHLYRGILFYRRKDFARAEEEFASALNFEMPAALQPDARAWRHMAAVAGGSCGTARQSLDLALPTVSPFFPRDEARSLASACTAE